MNKKVTKLGMIFALSGVLTVGAVSLSHKKAVVKVTVAATLPKTINIEDNTPDEILNYYSSLSSLPAEQLSGNNLLKNLKGIISNNVTYFSYSQVTDAYLITDRDWINSPASAMSDYDESAGTVKVSYSTEKTNNPYIHMLYHDYTNPSKNKTHYTGDGDMSSTSKSFDNEHAWSQSHGFFNGTGDPLVGAGTDLHHLIAGTQYGNRTLHNNYSYGFVKQNDANWTSAMSSYPYEKYNKRGEQLFAHSQDQQTTVFEPQDSDKGDIARALLYMVACYNNLDGSTPTPANPALALKNYVIGDTTGYSSDNIENGYYGILQDILAWHRMDPVDEYEIHRNNLIYNNYQHNRNPFIDYPEWVEYIWGTSVYDSSSRTISYDSTSTGHVDLSNDELNGYIRDRKPVTNVQVTSLPTTREYVVGESLNKAGMVVIATFDDETTADVTLVCDISPKKFTSVGETTVTVTYKGHSDSFTVNVSKAPEEPEKKADMKTILIYVAIGVGAVILIVLIATGIVKVNKKGKVKVSKSGVKKVVKKTTKKKKK